MEKIVIMVLITLTMGQAKDDLEIMKEMMAEMKMEMNERLSLAEGKLAKTEDELTATKDDLAITKEDLDTMKKMMAEMKMEMNERLVRTEAELAITKDALMSNIEELEMKTEMMAEMNERLSLAEGKLAKTEDELTATKDECATTKAKTDELEREVAILRAPPYIHSCGSHFGVLSGSYMTIPYTSLLYSSTNTEGGGLDISTGVFTAPHGGSYTVYWDTSAVLHHGEYVRIYLQKNGENIKESRHYSYYGGPSGVVRDQGGRTIIVYLGVGDTLQLYRYDGSGEIFYTTFCVSLTTFDIV